MNLILHQFRKDLRHTWLLLLLWLGVLLLQSTLVGASARPQDSAWQAIYQLIALLTVAFGFLLQLVLVPQVIQDEPVVGTTAFWLTRPLSRKTLLASKGLFLFFLLLLPQVVEAVVLLGNGVPLSALPLVLLWQVVQQLSFLLIWAMLAALTPNFGRFAILGTVYLVVTYLLLSLFQMERLFHESNDYFINDSVSLASSRSLVSCFFTIGVGLLVLFSQYLWRRERLSRLFVIIGLPVSLFIAQYWPWNFLQPRIRLEPDTAIQQMDLQLTPASQPFQTDGSNRRGGLSDKALSINLALPGLASDYVVHLNRIESQLRQPDGTVLTYASDQENSGQESASSAAIQQALGIPLLNRNQNGDRPGDRQSCRIFSVHAPVYEKYADVPSTLSSQVQGQILKYRISAELPLQQGAEFRRSPYREALTQILRRPNGLELSFRRQDLYSPFALRFDQDISHSQNSDLVVYALVNRTRHQAVLARRNEAIFSGLGGDPEQPLSHDSFRLVFGPDGGHDANWLQPALDETWLQDATLVRLELVPVREFTQPLLLPDVRLDAQFKIAHLAGEKEGSAVPSQADLDKITLPLHASRQQTTDYILAVLTATQAPDYTYQKGDPEIGLLHRVGAQNVDLLVQLARHNHNFYLDRAIDDLVAPDHQPLILAALPENHDLIETVIDRHWEQAAHAILLQELRAGDPANPPFLPDRWIQAVISLHDPASYPALTDYLTAHPPGTPLLEQVKLLPGFDFPALIDQGWKRAQTTGNEGQAATLLPYAFFLGEPDALERAKILLKATSPYARQAARLALRHSTPATGVHDADLLVWLHDHRADLVYDPAQHKFILKPAAPLTPSAPATH